MVKKKRSATTHKKVTRHRRASRSCVRPSNKSSKRKAAPKRRSGAYKARDTFGVEYKPRPSGILLPPNIELKPVAPDKIKKGIGLAKKQIRELIVEIDDLTDGFVVHEIECALSFSVDGKFVGIGVGGAATIVLRFQPGENAS